MKAKVLGFRVRKAISNVIFMSEWYKLDDRNK